MRHYTPRRVTVPYRTLGTLLASWLALAPAGAAEPVGAETCESCHGNGHLYSLPFVMRDRELARALGLLDPGEKTCLRCHDESSPSLSRFDYARKLPLVAHGRADREARRAAARPAPP